MLPFTAPDEPLYLIYAINRIVQVRAGPLEANFKAWNSSLLQRDSQSTPYGNGIYQQGLEKPSLGTQMDLNGTFCQNTFDQPSSNDMRSVDLNGNQPISYDMRSVDLNGTIQQQPGDALSKNGNSELHVGGYSNFCGISNDDLEKIQVI